MNNYLKKANWEASLFNRLNDLIDKYKKPYDVLEQDKDYVVFDCDDSLIFSDIECEFLDFYLKKLHFKQTPEEFEEQIYSGNFDYNASYKVRDSEFIAGNLAEDLVAHYQSIYDVYLNPRTESKISLENLKETELYRDFYVKYLVFYDLFWQESHLEPGKAASAAFFKGQSKSRLEELTRICLKERLGGSISENKYYSGDKFSYQTIVRRGMQLIPEMLDLVESLQNNGIAVYIVSGSIQEVVSVLASDYLKIPAGNVYGTRYVYSNSGIIQGRFSKYHPIALGEGKVEVINQFIIPRHLGKEPIAVFGNSQSDYPMMSEYNGTELSVLISDGIYMPPTSKYWIQKINPKTGEFVGF